MLLSEILDKPPHFTFVDVHALVVKKAANTARNGSTYANIVLRDKDTSLKFIKFNYNAEKYDTILEVGEIVKVSGCSKPYNDTITYEITTIEPSTKPVTDFIKKSKIDSEACYTRMLTAIDSFSEPLPKYIATQLLLKYKTEFCSAPAATKVHQAWHGGLIEHTFNMFVIANSIIDYYLSNYGSAYISKDKVLFGIILHDLGKIFEYDIKSPSFKKTILGRLENHIIKCATIIHEVATEWFNKEYKLLHLPEKFDFELEKAQLIHLITSHHGKHEYGSPMIPSTLEALIVHHIDMLDSQFMHGLELVESKEGSSSFSEYSSFTNTSYLKLEGLSYE